MFEVSRMPLGSLRAVISATLALLITGTAWAQAPGQDTRNSALAPDIRGEDAPLTLQDGDFVVVPIPISNPTLGTGLVAGAAYFYPQTEEQKKVEPPSVTGIGGMYTTNDSKAIAIAQQTYWGKNRWRMTGALGSADVRVNLIQPDESTGTESVDWNIRGTFLYVRLSRKLYSQWYGGLYVRAILAQQEIAAGGQPEDSSGDFGLDDANIVGPGLRLEYDSRDKPMNSYSGVHFEGTALFNDKAFGSERTYQGYNAVFRSYHALTDNLVFAWETNACRRTGEIPLWDACKIPLRGFSAFDYLGKISVQAQGELRWKMSKRWGMVGFAGVGQVGEAYEGLSDYEAIPSYGLGIRFTVLPSQRINLRVDFARSEDDQAVHVSVGEAF